MARQLEALKMNMERTDIPGTSLRVSPVAIRTWAIGGWMWGGTDEAESIATIQAAFDHGINLVDTAPVYGFGHSEEVVGKALAGMRERAVIATKVALADVSPVTIVRAESDVGLPNGPRSSASANRPATWTASLRMPAYSSASTPRRRMTSPRI